MENKTIVLDWVHEPVETSQGFKLEKITTSRVIDTLTKNFLKYWKDDIRKEYDIKFPGVQPVSLERKDFDKLLKEPYVVCAKLDGQRYMLYCTTIDKQINDPSKGKINTTLLVDRLMNFYIITAGFINADVYEKETILDGEILNDGNFIIHDCIILGGQNVKNNNWSSRWRNCQEFINKNYKLNNQIDTFNIGTKRFHNFLGIYELFTYLELCKSDGIVFYPMKDGVKYRTQYNLFKWKTKHTIDFKVKVTQKYVTLITWSKGQEQNFKKIPKNKFSGNQFKNLKNNDVVEIDGALMEPLFIRKDKSQGNSLFTVNKTLLNVQENITKNDLIELSEKALEQNS